MIANNNDYLGGENHLGAEMNLAVKISLLSSGLFLLFGMLIGIVKHQRMLKSTDHTAPAYIDIAHRAAFL